MEESECPIYLFHSCTKTNFLWTSLQHSFQNVLIIPSITPQSVIFGVTGHKINCHLRNHILLIFKYYVYKTRGNGLLDFQKNIERQISLSKPEKQINLNKNGNRYYKTHITFFKITWWHDSWVGMVVRLLFFSLCMLLFSILVALSLSQKCLTDIFSWVILIQ